MSDGDGPSDARTGGRPSASSTPTVLGRILQSTREQLERRKRELPEPELIAQAKPDGPLPAGHGGDSRGRFHEALRGQGVGVIAEFKRRSPSAGTLRRGADVAQMVGAYERGGALALSVLTEGPNFDGSLEDLRTARGASSLPLLRKDFVVDPYQLHEARAAGADAVLLIVAALSAAQLAELHEQGRALGLDVLVEVHDEQELSVALGAGARLIGVNNRDLRDFTVDVQRTHTLLEQMPAGSTVVSESGIGTPAQLAQLHDAGVAAVLVGESLMRSSDPERALRELRAYRAGVSAPS